MTPFVSVAPPAMLKCTLRPAHEVTHPAVPMTPTPIPVLKDDLLDRVLANYRESARRAINYAWGHGWDNPVHKPMVQVPKASVMPTRTFKPLPLITQNGKRRPLRAFPYRELNRQFWSQGKVVNEDALERNKARELASLKDPAEMTLDELIATQNADLISESKRSYLETGVGVLTLDKAEYEEGSIGEMLAATSDEPITIEIGEPDWDATFEGRAAMVETLDPITEKQIDWEKAQYYTSDVISYKRTGEKSIINTSPRTVPADKFRALVARTFRALLPDAGSDEPLRKRAEMLTKEQVRVLGERFDRYVNNEVDRAMSLDDEIVHGSYEFTVYDADGNERTMLAHHRPYRWVLGEGGQMVRRMFMSPEDRRYGPWKGTRFDYDDFSLDSSDESEYEDMAGSTECPSCHEGLIPTHSNVLDGPYAGLVFCTAECGYAEYHMRQTRFDLRFGRFNEEVA